MRLIDVDALIEKHCEGCSKDIRSGCKTDPVCATLMWFEEAPTIDAVPVVRCKDCKHAREKNEHEKNYLVEDVLICTSPDVSDDCWSAVWPYHFCSYGERKDG